ncbi:uroporphyrinogen-III C-methyltransferase [Pedobacter sp. SYP-B3415]|uniref:uroporphyrinogen-III C-methyltransferase n=1 Tax=Pedobacter sp. SYP-B3415 TaxID=2496641 RepID=UPI00101DAF2C|nr:uroporphyrinogen-III C-methyltransferase [Pedobacter sp. SYP-B3415]
MNTKEPRITLVGAGPGDPELITLKGLKALQSADVVLYDALVGEAMLDHVPAAAVKIYVGKRSGEHAYAQETINRLMVDYAVNYGHVVRLKGGDPFVFGRGYEELEFAAAHHIPATVVPGISSSIAVAGIQQIPVTHRGMSESFWVVTGTTTSGQVSADIYDAARSNATVVVLMGLKKLQEITNIFAAAGRADLPAAIIQDGSTPAERMVSGTVRNIAETAAREQIKAPSVLIFGEVVSLHPSFRSLQVLHAGVTEK